MNKKGITTGYLDQPKVKKSYPSYRSAHSPRFHQLLSDVLADVYISMDNCGSSGIEEKDLYGAGPFTYTNWQNFRGGIYETYNDFSGRLATSAIYDLNTSKIYTQPDQTRIKNLASGIENQNLGLSNDPVRIRYQLSCQAESGICSRCYGIEYPEGTFLKVGTPIGSNIAKLISEKTRKAGFKHPSFFLTRFALTLPEPPPGEKIKIGISPQIAYRYIANYLEGRHSKNSTILAKHDGVISFGKHFSNGRYKIIIIDLNGERFEYILSHDGLCHLKEGHSVHVGDTIMYGSGGIDPKDVLEIYDEYKALLSISYEVMENYWYAGVKLNYNQIEIVVREMLKWVKVIDAGDSILSLGETISRRQFNIEADRITQLGGRIPTSMKRLLGLSEVLRLKLSG